MSAHEDFHISMTNKMAVEARLDEIENAFMGAKRRWGKGPVTELTELLLHPVIQIGKMDAASFTKAWEASSGFRFDDQVVPTTSMEEIDTLREDANSLLDGMRNPENVGTPYCEIVLKREYNNLLDLIGEKLAIYRREHGI